METTGSRENLVVVTNVPLVLLEPGLLSWLLLAPGFIPPP